MLQATCHCGSVKLQVPGKPAYLVDCNCSICLRNGALWTFYERGTVKVLSNPVSTSAYVWGAATIRTMHCKTCGIATHWEAIDPATDNRIGVNARNLEPDEIRDVPVRKFDGAVTWTYLE